MSNEPATDQVAYNPNPKPKPASPIWWLALFAVGGLAGQLSAMSKSPWFMLVGIVAMFLIYRKINAHNIQPKDLKQR